MLSLNDVDKLEELKYSQLQKLAKQLGIKANIKHEKLLISVREELKKSAARPKTPIQKSAQKNITKSESIKRIGTPVSEKRKSGSVTGAAQRISTPLSQKSTKSPGLVKTDNSKHAKKRLLEKSFQKETIPNPSKRRRHNTHETDKPKAAPETPEQERRSSRRNTFETAGSNLPGTPTIEGEKTNNEEKLSRRASGANDSADSEIAFKTPDSAESSENSLINCMSGDMSNEEMKKSLSLALNKKVAKSRKNGVSGSTDGDTGFAEKVNKAGENNNKSMIPKRKLKTPDWKKIHKKAFSKMESIDDFLERRKKIGCTSESVNRAKQTVKEVRMAVSSLQNNKTPDIPKTTFKSPSVLKRPPTPFKPSVLSTKNANFSFGRKSQTPGLKSPKAVNPKTFKPSVTSTKNMDLNFNSMTTPANRKSTESSSKLKSTTVPGSNAKSANKYFKFNANTTLNSTLDKTKSKKKKVPTATLR